MALLNKIGPFAVVLATIMGCTTTVAQRQPADLIVINTKVHTLDAQRPHATAFAVKGGKFIAVGADTEIEAHLGEKTRVINANGRTIIPGLNDSHSVRGGRFFNLETRWDGVLSLAEAAAYAPPVRKMMAIGIPVGAGTDGTRVSSLQSLGVTLLAGIGQNRGWHASFCQGQQAESR